MQSQFLPLLVSGVKNQTTKAKAQTLTDSTAPPRTSPAASILPSPSPRSFHRHSACPQHAPDERGCSSKELWGTWQLPACPEEGSAQSQPLSLPISQHGRGKALPTPRSVDKVDGSSRAFRGLRHGSTAAQGCPSPLPGSAVSSLASGVRHPLRERTRPCQGALGWLWSAVTEGERGCWDAAKGRAAASTGSCSEVSWAGL